MLFKPGPNKDCNDEGTFAVKSPVIPPILFVKLCKFAPAPPTKLCNLSANGPI